MGAAVDDVHHRDGEHIGVGAADIAVQGDVEVVGGSVGNCEAHAEDGVGAELALGGGAVELDHSLVNGALLKSGHTYDSGGNDVVHVGNSLEDALAEVALLVAVAKLEGFVLAGGCSRRNSCYSLDAGFEDNFYFNCGIAPGIEDFPTCNLNDSHIFD